jgi:glutamine cyclotransferase
MTQNGFFRCRQMLLVPLLGLLFFIPVSLGDTLKLIRKIPHSGYSEGLDFYQGYLWNAIKDQILKINPEDGTVIARFKPPTEHSESVAWFEGRLYNLSFSDDGIYSAVLNSRGALKFERKGSTPEVHGWGLTHNGSHLIMTGNYSSKLYFANPKNLKVVKTIETQGKDLEDLAWDGQWVWSSSFTTEHGKIFAIHPSSGKIMGTYSLPDENCPIIDGIAYDGKGLWITGKECPSIYYVKKPNVQKAISKK